MNYNKAAYIGLEDEFHKLFKVNERDIKPNLGIANLALGCQTRLKRLYAQIERYLK